MKPGEALIEAAKKQAEGEIAVHLANIKVYQTMPAGIGEHSDVTEAVIEELNKLAAANDRLEMIENISSLNKPNSPSGEIGRHAGFRYLCLTAWGFKSLLGHHNHFN